MHKGRSVAFVEGELRTEDGELVATATATLRIATTNGNGPQQSSMKIAGRER